MPRRTLLTTALAAAAMAAAPGNTDATSSPRGVCHGRKYTMHQFIRYGRRVMPVPTKGQQAALARMAHCMWAPRLRAVARAWQRRHQLRLGAHYSWDTTAYSYTTCDGTGGGGKTSLGTTVHFGEVAVIDGTLPLGTWIYMDRPIHGRRLFRVEDHIGTGSQLDVFEPCEWDPAAFGHQQLGFRVVR